MSHDTVAAPPVRFNFARHLLDLNAARAAKTALIDDQGTLSYGQLADAVPFGDHHPYSKGDLQFLRRLAQDHSARLITTSKDHVRLRCDGIGAV